MDEQTNGNTTRLEQLEKWFDLLTADHESFRHEHKQLLTAQVLLQDGLEQTRKLVDDNTRQMAAVRDELRTLGEKTDERIGKVISAIGELTRQSLARKEKRIGLVYLGEDRNEWLALDLDNPVTRRKGQSGEEAIHNLLLGNQERFSIQIIQLDEPQS